MKGFVGSETHGARARFLTILLFVWTLALPAGASSACSVLPGTEKGAQGPRNVILFIADGGGPASFTLARNYLRESGTHEELALDAIKVGSIRTYSANRLVTDSAAAATALASGIKTDNSAIAVDPLGRPVATLLEGAARRGMVTGLVATSRITHATPAAFSARVPHRDLEDLIAEQQLEGGIGLLFGGGRQHFLPPEERGRREDGRNLLEEAAARGFQIAGTREEFDRLDAVPIIALFAMDHMAYEIDRDASLEPSLAEMTEKAIELLGRNTEGFFLMVEGARIDHAGHANDPASLLHEVLAFDQAVAAALEFARRNGETLVVATADHETGGLSIRSGAITRLSDVKRSHAGLIREILAGERTPDEILSQAAGIEELAAEELALLEEALGVEERLEEDLVVLHTMVARGVDTAETRLNAALSQIVSRRAALAWTSRGHTGVDVGLYAFGPGRDGFVGHHNNTHVGQRIALLLDLDLEALTAELGSVKK